jgi:DNA-binding CsgD family transcriptional regulator/tetratricopeptide (TPR) repeat protein
MTTRPGVVGSALVGRVEETRIVATLLGRAAAGDAGALLIFGDAGVGKTALMLKAGADAAPDTLVLPGACLPLTSLAIPFVAIRTAIRAARSDGVTLPRVFSPGEPISDVPVVFDAWLDDLCRDQPVMLAIDDLQWADQSTLDLLMYVLAGPPDRRLAVIATIRAAEIGEGHLLQRWLADIRHLPRVDQLTLGTLDRVATGDQLAGLLGAPPHQSLIEDVFTHTLGNAYLNRLVVSGLDPNARHLPPDLPSDLKSAVLQSWRRLSSTTRELARILAVGGGPLRVRDLDAVLRAALTRADRTATKSGPRDGVVQRLLREAVDAGVIDLARNETYWFHHPVIAEVLERTLTDQERVRWHSAFASHYEKLVTDDPATAVEALVEVADHHYQAGHLREAYEWALQASGAAAAAGGTAEMLRLLRRAVDLRDKLPSADESRHQLLTRLWDAAAAAGAHEDELDTVELLLGATDPSSHPLDVAELMVRRMHLRFSTGREFFDPNAMREAVRISAVEPGSWQHAFALAELAHAGVWQDDPDAGRNASRALEIARAAGHPRALSYALAANAVVAVTGSRAAEGLVFAAEGVEAASEAHDYWAFFHATLWEGNAQETWASATYANILRARREQLVGLGAPHAYIAMLAADEASSWLAIGNWREALNRLRFALGSDPGPFADVMARLTAALLAAWQGRTDEAVAHLARADELFSLSSEFLNYHFDAVRAVVNLATVNPAAAFEAALAGATSPGMPPTMCEWLLPFAARALADQIRSARDAGRNPADILGQLNDLVTRFPHVLRESGESTALWEIQISALDDLYRAEVGRARDDAENGEQWVRTVEACHSAMLAWDETYACWRGAEALLRRGHHNRDEAASVLRRGLALAEELEARPVLAELEALAASARIPVDRVPVMAMQGGADAETSASGALLDGLTAREREILDHVVAGRTYGEIARTLVISEKTVSSHISNLLRKTGTANRVDLSRLAARASQAGRDR